MKRLFLFLLLVSCSFAAVGGPDEYGYIFADCSESEVTYSWYPTNSATPVSGWEVTGPEGNSATRIYPPFSINFYGNSYDSFMVSTNGFVTFSSAAPESFYNLPIPSTYNPRNLVAAYWDNLRFGPTTRVYHETVGEAPLRVFVLTWENVYINSEFIEHGTHITPNTFQIAFYEKPGETDIKIQYHEIGSLVNPNGTAATVGIEDITGTIGLSYCYYDSVIFSEMAIMFTMGFYERDVGVYSSSIPDTALTGSEIIPIVTVGNPGRELATDIDLNLRMYDSALRTVHTETVRIDSMLVGATDTITFSGWTPTIHCYPGDYRMVVWTDMPDDENPRNDTLETEFFVLAYDFELADILIRPLLIPGSFVDMVAVVRNRGGEMATGSVTGLLFSDIDTVFSGSADIALASGGIDTVSVGHWIADSGHYELEFSVDLSGDQVPDNDAKIKEVAVYSRQTRGGPDDFGYEWFDSWYDFSFAYSPIDITDATRTALRSTGSSPVETITLSLPFEFPFYGESYTRVHASMHGFVSFNNLFGRSYGSNQPLAMGRSANTPNAVIAGFWDYLYIYDPFSVYGVYTKTGEHTFHIIYYNVYFFADAGTRHPIIFEIVLHDDGGIVFNYEKIEVPELPGNTMGRRATIGIENSDGSTGLQYLYNGYQPGNQILNHSSITFTPSGAPPDTFPPVIIPLVTADTLYFFDDSSSVTLSARIFDLRSDIVSESLYYSFDGIDYAIAPIGFDAPDICHFFIDGLDIDGELSGEYYARDSEGNVGTLEFSHTIYHPYIDTIPPVIIADVYDTLWIIPGFDGFTYTTAVMVDSFGIVEYDSVYVFYDGYVSAFSSDSVSGDDTYHYTIGPFYGGEPVGIKFFAMDSSGNVAEYPEIGELEFIAWEEHIWGPLEDDLYAYWMMDNFLETDDDSLYWLIPSYSWVEIDPASGGRGRVIEDAESNWISDPITFASLSFPFYHENEPHRTSLRVSSTGFITFDNSFDAPLPEPSLLPSEEYPRLVIAPLHANFTMDERSRILFLEDIVEQRIIVQWQDMAFETVDTTIYATFQIIMRCNTPVIGGFYNDIKFQYKDVEPWHLEHFSIGFQDFVKSSGMAYPTRRKPDIAKMPVSGSALRVFNARYEAIEEMVQRLPEGIAISRAYPNPFNSSCRVDFTSSHSGYANINIFSVNGLLIESSKVEINYGHNTFEWAPANVNSGIYFLRIDSGDFRAEERLLYIK